MTFTIILLVHFHNIKTCVGIAVKILFEERKKIETESLAEGNALILIIKIHQLLLSFDSFGKLSVVKLNCQKHPKPYDA